MGVVIFGMILLQSYVYYRYWDKGLEIDFRFSSKEAFEGDAVFLNTEIVNRKPLPLPWLLVEYQLSSNLVFPGNTEYEIGDLQKTGLFSVMAYRRIRRRIEITCARRGFYRLRHTRLAASNLLHTKTFRKRLQCLTELTVFPRVLDHSEALNVIINQLDALLLVRALINPDPFTFRGIREYQPTDPLRCINFMATAVAMQPMVNLFMPASSKHLEIILDLEHNLPHTSEERFEQCIRLAATAARHYIGEDVMVGFHTNGRDVLTGENMHMPRGAGAPQLYAVYHALARLGLAYKPEPLSLYLNTLNDIRNVYLIISSYKGTDLMAAADEMQARGLAVYVLAAEATG
jgi:uncharacterized protein (DUF58 family)